MTTGTLGESLRLRKPRNGLFGGIGQRLLIRVVLFSSAVTLILTCLQLYLDYSRDVSIIKTRLDEIGHSSLASISQALWSLNASQLELQLQGILRLPHIRAAEVHEASFAQNPLILTAGERGDTAVIRRDFPILYQVRGVDQTIGTLYVEASLAEVYRSLIDKALFILVSQGAKTFIVSLFIVYIFYRLVTRHLADIAYFLGGSDLRNSDQELSLDRSPPEKPDELDEVVSSFNRMLAGLQKSYEQLRQANHQLKVDNRVLTRTEAALRKSEQLFRDYTDTASDWLWEAGPDHRFTYFSDEVGAFGVDRDRLIGSYRWDNAADVEMEAEKWREHRAALERHEPFRGFVYSFRHKDGTLRYTSTSGKPLFDEDGRFLGYRGTARDVTERSRAEARVRELSSAVEQSPAGIAIVDPAGCVTYSNHMFMKITGLAESEGQAMMSDILPGDVWKRLSEAAQRGEVVSEEIFATPLSQESFWGLISVASIQTLDKSEGRLVVALQDITREKAEQQEREALQLRLQETGKMEAVGRLAGGIAHDFNNLLGAMMGFSQFLVEDLAKDSDSHKHAERVLAMCEKGRGLVEQLLAFARARETERRVVDLMVVLDDCRDLLDASLPSTSRLEISIGDTPLPVLGNDGQLQQVMLNLCLNARDALGGVPGLITVELSRVRPDHTACSEAAHTGVGKLLPDHDYALLAISDTGAGMDAATRAQIFEPFFTTKGLGRGTGLGLAVVHGIVVSYGGHIHVESAPGEGTTFEVYLPIAEGAPQAFRAQEEQPGEVHGEERVLVVDDDPDLVQALTIGLNRYGYEVLSLTDPLKALKLFTETPDHWDIVVSDQVMPGLTGLEMIDRLKDLRSDLLAILYTGFDEGTTERTATAYGVDKLLHKPISPRHLAGHIRRLVAEKAAPQS